MVLRGLEEIDNQTFLSDSEMILKTLNIIQKGKNSNVNFLLNFLLIFYVVTEK